MKKYIKMYIVHSHVTVFHCQLPLQKLIAVVQLKIYFLITPAHEFLLTYFIQPVTAIRHSDITAFRSVPQCIGVTKVFVTLAWITVMRWGKAEITLDVMRLNCTKNIRLIKTIKFQRSSQRRGQSRDPLSIVWWPLTCSMVTPLWDRCL